MKIIWNWIQNKIICIFFAIWHHFLSNFYLITILPSTQSIAFNFYVLSQIINHFPRGNLSCTTQRHQVHYMYAIWHKIQAKYYFILLYHPMISFLKCSIIYDYTPLIVYSGKLPEKVTSTNLYFEWLQCCKIQ